LTDWLGAGQAGQPMRGRNEVNFNAEAMKWGNCDKQSNAKSSYKRHSIELSQ